MSEILALYLLYNLSFILPLPVKPICCPATTLRERAREREREIEKEREREREREKERESDGERERKKEREIDDNNNNNNEVAKKGGKEIMRGWRKESSRGSNKKKTSTK